MTWQYLNLLNVDLEWQLSAETTATLVKLTWIPSIGYDVAGRALIGQAWVTDQGKYELFGIRRAYAKNEGDLYELSAPAQYPQSRRIAFRFLPAPYWSRLQSVLVEQWVGDAPPPTGNTYNINFQDAPSFARLTGASTSGSTSGVDYPINFTTAIIQGFTNTENGLLTVLESGFYLVTYRLQFSSTSTAGERVAWVNNSGNQVLLNQSAGSASSIVPLSLIQEFLAGNTLRLVCRQTSGTQLPLVNANISIVKVA
ncbi:MAG: hypothetical protein KME20_13265 [Kaiparowitsia implicata GSE-PSE-MK54-09C]|jgi:hypothetical protein|nr:hypothetical protein [Kaiparowitsia implicata GSE-PSE-MK54-09C]